MRKSFAKTIAPYAAAMMLCASIFVAGSGYSSAAPLTCGGMGGYEGFGNYTRLPVNARETPIGVSGAITARLPDICGNQVPGDIFSFVWVLIGDRDTMGLAQAGLALETGTAIPHPSTCLQDFYEWHHDGNSHFIAPAGGRVRFSTCIADGSQRQYSVRSTSTDKNFAHFAFSIAPYPGSRGGDLYTTQWTRADWTFIVPQYFAETNNAGADIVGTVLSKSSIYSIGIQPSDGSAQMNTPCYLQIGNSAPRGNVSSSGCLTTYQWSN